jgi:hypothetical protein
MRLILKSLAVGALLVLPTRTWGHKIVFERGQNTSKLGEWRDNQGFSRYGTPTDGMIEVTIFGAVGRPGIYYLQKGATLQNAIDACGGPDKMAQLGNIRVDNMLHQLTMIISLTGVEGSVATKEIAGRVCMENGDLVHIAKTIK